MKIPPLFPKNKKGGFLELFLLMILSFIIILFCVVFVYIGNLTTTKLHESLDTMNFGNQNTSQTIDNTFGELNTAYSNLKWITVMLIFGMVLSIFIGSWKVTTEPIYFVPYIIITIIAIIVSVGIANSYETIMNTPTLAGTFADFQGANYFMLNLPIFITIIGFAGGVIMFIRWAGRDQTGGYGYGG